MPAYPNHQDIRPAYVQPNDPGAVKAGVFWVDTSFPQPFPIKVRNLLDTGWDLIGTASPFGGPVQIFQGEEGEEGPLGPPGLAPESFEVLLSKRVSSQFDKTDIVLANVTGLAVDVLAGHSYSFEAVLFITASSGGGSQFAVGGAATASAIIYEVLLVDDNTNATTITSRQTALGGSVGQTGTTSGLCLIKGLISVSASGTLTVQFAQNAAVGTSSVIVGSTFLVREVR